MLHVKVFPFNPLQENTYLVYDGEGRCAVIDPGCYTEGEREALRSYLSSKGLRPVWLLNTHCHLDHVFGNLFVAETYGLQPQIHPLEQRVLDFAPASGLMWDLPFDHYGGEVGHLVPGHPVTIGEDSLQVLFLPGHSPGHVGFYCAEQGFLISGDVLFREGVGRTDLPGGDAPTLVRSIREVLFALPDETVVHTGHGPSTTIGWEKRHNPFVGEAV
jgi:hydroxyacylglutathione hydrolase